MMRSQIHFLRSEAEVLLSQVLQIWSDKLAGDLDDRKAHPMPPIWNVAKDLTVTINALTDCLHRFDEPVFEEVFDFLLVEEEEIDYNGVNPKPKRKSSAAKR